MSVFSSVFNIDIRSDIKRNILDYQSELCKKADSIIKKYEFNHWMNTKQWLVPSLELRIQFNNLYFNYMLNELVNGSKKIMSRDFDALKKIWLLDYTSKFWSLQIKYKLNQNMTQEEFNRLLTVGEKI